jgi:hypothetical protein
MSYIDLLVVAQMFVMHFRMCVCELIFGCILMLQFVHIYVCMDYMYCVKIGVFFHDIS